MALITIATIRKCKMISVDLIPCSSWLYYPEEAIIINELSSDAFRFTMRSSGDNFEFNTYCQPNPSGIGAYSYDQTSMQTFAHVLFMSTISNAYGTFINFTLLIINAPPSPIHREYYNQCTS